MTIAAGRDGVTRNNLLGTVGPEVAVTGGIVGIHF